MSKPASEISINQLIDTLNKDFECHGKSMSDSLSLWKVSDKHSDKIPDYSLKRIKALSCIMMTYSLAQLELSALIKANFCNRDKDQLRRSYLFQVNRVIAESLKAIFGFSVRDRKYSYWHELETYCDLSSYQDDIKCMIDDVNRLADETNDYISHNARNVASHYDVDPLKIEAELSCINDEDRVAVNASAYLKVIVYLSSIIERIVLQDKKEYCIQTYFDNIDSPVQPIIWNIESRVLKPRIAFSILSTYKINAEYLSKLLKVVHLKENLQNLLKEKNISVDTNAPELVFYDSVLRYVCLILYMQNDVLASAYAASTSSNSFECYVHLKRVYVSIYETLDKIYGLKGRAKSFFSYIDLGLEHMPPEIIAEYESVKEAIRDYLTGDGGRYADESIRNSFLHYRNGKNRHVVQGCSGMLNMHLTQEFDNIIRIVNIMNRVQTFLYHLTAQKKIMFDKESKAKINTLFESIRDIVRNGDFSPEIKKYVENEIAQIASSVNKVKQFTT